VKRFTEDEKKATIPHENVNCFYVVMRKMVWMMEWGVERWGKRAPGGLG
jgi:hypothetical protein